MRRTLHADEDASREDLLRGAVRRTDTLTSATPRCRSPATTTSSMAAAYLRSRTLSCAPRLQRLRATRRNEGMLTSRSPSRRRGLLARVGRPNDGIVSALFFARTRPEPLVLGRRRQLPAAADEIECARRFANDAGSVDRRLRLLRARHQGRRFDASILVIDAYPVDRYTSRRAAQGLRSTFLLTKSARRRRLRIRVRTASEHHQHDQGPPPRRSHCLVHYYRCFSPRA